MIAEAVKLISWPFR